MGEAESIATDLPCVRCGYNLRMQPRPGLCPECGLPVIASLHQTILRWGSRRLRRIAWALRVQAITAIVAPLVLLAGIFLDRPIVSWLGYEYSQYVGIATFAGVALVAAVHTAAAWFSTGAPRGEALAYSRLLCRIGALTLPLVPLVPLAILLFEPLINSTGDVLLLGLPLLLAGWIIYAERAAACWTDFHLRAGLLPRAGFGKWSLRAFALSMGLLTAVVAGLVVLICGERYFNFDWQTYERVERILVPILLATLALASISLLLLVIALFRAANRAAELALLASSAELSGFTTPPPPNAPSSPSTSAASHPAASPAADPPHPPVLPA